MSYTIDGSLPVDTDGKYWWRVLSDGEEVARVKGPMSLAVAYAAVRELNKETVIKHGWLLDTRKYMNKERGK